jgi:hypothetical protein
MTVLSVAFIIEHGGSFLTMQSVEFLIVYGGSFLPCRVLYSNSAESIVIPLQPWFSEFQSSEWKCDLQS